ncbi:hypothetical protein PYK79_31820 [Streptomyces sp. ID05-04B]|uniref:hypothetical protein n=1 Tax=Streptomyces sp. ID05-04B TaxID=3028661 RepID=UPI0029C358A2|nr:hypothetical protein [Streptomyces sp. ID05-04B]MDX5566922.1 hypothetical protein [Streptomyces sp. ID05-04B]
MRVVVREAFKAYINHQPENFTPGQKIKGDTAVYLLSNNAAVDPDDDEAAALAATLAGEDPDDEGQDDGDEEREPAPPHSPPAPSNDPDGGPQNPAPSTELDIDGSVKDILAWVGEDTDRAGQALEAEQAQDKPRSTLVKQLEKTAGLSE